MKIIVIGSAAAGVSAALRLSAGEKGAQTTVYEAGAFHSCGAGGLPYYLSAGLPELHAAIQGKERELAAQNVAARLRCQVERIDPQARQITVRDLAAGQAFTDRYDKLVVATGAAPQIPQVPGCRRVGVQTLNSVEDLIFLKKYLRTPYVQDVVVLGGGWEGLELAKAVLKLGRKVRIITDSPQILPGLDPEVGQRVQQALEGEGVQLSLGESVRAFPGRTYVEQVQTSRGSYPCDLCLVAGGLAPNTGLLAAIGAELAPGGAALIDSNLETSVPNVCAAGACAVSREGSLHSGSVRVGGLEIARTGLTEAEAKRVGLRVRSATASGWDRPGVCPNPQEITIKLVYEASTRQIVGAQAWGGKNVSTRVNAIAVAIRAGMTADALSQVDFVYSSCTSSIWDPIQVVCGQAR